MGLTHTKLKALHGKARSKKLELPDRDGLTVVVGVRGKVSYVFRYRIDGKSRRITVGSYPAFSLDDAREKACKFKKQVESGKDPKSINGPRNVKYISECSQHWLDNYVEHLKDSTQTYYRSIASRFFIDSFFSYDVERARFDEWISFFDKIAKKTTRKNSGSTLKITKSMLRFCLSRGVISGSKVFDIQLKAIGEKSTVGQRTLALHEVAKIWIEIGRTKATPATKCCTKLLLIFGARNSEIRNAKRSEFDLKEMLWSLPVDRSKTSKIIRRPIPALAAKLIAELDEVYGLDGYLIPGAHSNTPMTTHSVARFCKRIWGKLHTSFGMEGFIPHDFRRTLSTRISEKGILPHVSEKMLGHELQGVMAVYNKHDWIEEQKSAYELWCDLIQSAVVEELSRT